MRTTLDLALVTGAVVLILAGLILLGILEDLRRRIRTWWSQKTTTRRIRELGSQRRERDTSRTASPVRESHVTTCRRS